MNGPWKAFKADGRHVTDDKWEANHESFGSSVHAPIKDARGVTVALVVAHAKNYSDLPDLRERCALIAAAPDLLAACIRATQFETGTPWARDMLAAIAKAQTSPKETP